MEQPHEHYRMCESFIYFSFQPPSKLNRLDATGPRSVVVVYRI